MGGAIQEARDTSPPSAQRLCMDQTVAQVESQQLFGRGLYGGRYLDHREWLASNVKSVMNSSLVCSTSFMNYWSVYTVSNEELTRLCVVQGCRLSGAGSSTNNARS